MFVGQDVVLDLVHKEHELADVEVTEVILLDLVCTCEREKNLKRHFWLKE